MSSARALLGRSVKFAASGWQYARRESTAPNVLDGPLEEAWRPPSPSAMVARRNVGRALRPTPDETGLCGWTTPDRAQARTDLFSGGSENCSQNQASAASVPVAW